MKICVVGAGRWGRNHIKALHEMGLLGGVVESFPAAQDIIRSLYPNTPLFSTLEESGALDFPAYTIAVPAEVHYKVAKSLLENGKHVLVEKPITLNSDDAKDLVRLASSKNLILMTGHLLLFHPAIRQIKTFIENGEIGKLQYIYSNRLNLGTVRKEENSLWSFAPHDISIFQYFVGQKPTQVRSTGGAFLQPHIHDTTITTLQYPSNIVGHIFVSWLHPFKEHRLVVIGSKGMLSFEDSSEDKALLLYKKGIDWVEGEPIKRDGPSERISYPNSAPLTTEMQHFVDCILGKETNNLISGEQGAEVLEILETAEHDLHRRSAEPSKREGVFVHETAFVDPAAVIGEGTKIWNFSNIQKNADIGKKCILGQNVNIGTNVKIGHSCKIQNNVSVYEGVELGDYVFCGPSMVFTNIMIPRSKYPQASSKFYLKTTVKEGASIGANATIVCGTTLGRFCLIGAGTVVTKDVPDFAIVVGNPGKVIGWISEAGTHLKFDATDRFFCEKSQKYYVLSQNHVQEIEGVLTCKH
ncbi:MAG: oxidoreductase [Candidatus Margulisbacteria bacterium]|nr:oxidoreductase [Candidatus Margulisiibacteriota bacterium]